MIFQGTESRTTRLPALALAFALALAADQGTKALALTFLEPGVPLPVFPGLNLTLGFNTGASFGILSQTMAGRPEAMAVLTGLITLLVAVLAIRARHGGEGAGYAVIAGGASGNILDRVRQGAVTDFLDVYWRDWHWPTFNFADVAIFCGVAMVLVCQVRRGG